MKLNRFFTLFIVFSLIIPVQLFARSAPDSFADMVEKLSPAVVYISTSQTIKAPEHGGFGGLGRLFGDVPEGHPFEQFNELFKQFNVPDGFGGGRDRKTESLGSGFVISGDGYIVTNHHVVDKADEITITLNGGDHKYQAELIGSDKKTDLAVLKIKGNIKEPLPYVKFGNSDKSRVGDWVLIIGNPFGLGGTVTAGIISSKARDINAGPFDDFIQTDAAINRGNSGGPMFNMEGDVIGINTAIFSPNGVGSVGIGFAIPSNLATNIIEQIKDGGKVQRGWLGVRIQQITDEIAESMGLENNKGALVAEVMEDSPAMRAGVQVGDLIIEFDGKEVTTMKKLPRIVAETPHDKKVKMKIIRDGDEEILKVITGDLATYEEIEVAESGEGEFKGESSDEAEGKILGMKLSRINSELRKKFSIDKSVKGLLISEVDRDSAAFERNVRVGDVILEVNQIGVFSIADLKAVISDAKDKKRKSVLLLVHRAGDTLFIAIPVEDKK